MSLAFKIRNLDDVIRAFAAKEEFISALTLIRHDKEYTMTPTDEYYVAPYCFLSTVSRHHSTAGYLIFSSMVPFGKTFPTFEIPKINESEGYPGDHDEALDLMNRHGHHNTKGFLFLANNVEWFQQKINCHERDIYTFTPEGYYPSINDVSQKLEDMAFHVICDLVKWKYPVNWRRKRAEQLYTFCSILDLADYDNEQRRLEVEEEKRLTKLMKLKQQKERSKTMEYTHHYPNNNDNRIVHHAKDKEEEEKKESANAFDKFRYQSSSPSYYDERGGGFLERTPDSYDDYYGGGGNTFISDYNTVYDEDFLGI